MGNFSIKGNLVDALGEKIFSVEVFIEKGIIKSIQEIDFAIGFLLPGLVDSHIHIESSIVSPLEFAKVAVKHGTVAVVSDPHEIANVLGVKGIDYMIKNASNSPLKFFFGAPSCVPVTAFETSGAVLDLSEIQYLLGRDDVHFLSEMMNYPGVLNNDEILYGKLETAKRVNKPIDGHAPGLTASALQKYIDSGISTDHECLNIQEAEEKITLGMMIQIREGSASKSFNTLLNLINKYPDQVMLCSDDLHPEDLLKGHINLLFKKGLDAGISIFKLIKVAVINPIKHYKLNVGFLQIGQPADFILVNDLKNFTVQSTFINGVEVYSLNNGINFNYKVDKTIVNKFESYTINAESISVVNEENKQIRIIDIIDKELFTKQLIDIPKTIGNIVVSDTNRDYLKVIIVNRYNKSIPSVGFVHNFGIKEGAVATSISHDSHNVIAIGANDDDLIIAINSIMDMKGGIVFCNNKEVFKLILPIAGLMSNESVDSTALSYKLIEDKIRKAGSKLSSPLMTLSFLSLIVIPELKISDKGLFDVNDFKFVPLFV